MAIPGKSRALIRVGYRIRDPSSGVFVVCTPLGPPSSTTIVRVAPRDKHRPGGDRAIGSACRQRCGRYRLWWRSPGSRGRGWWRSLGGRRDFRQRLASAVAHDEGSGAEYLVGRAQKLPLPDASIGIALFMRTLHHVPSSELAHALREARPCCGLTAPYSSPNHCLRATISP